MRKICNKNGIWDTFNCDFIPQEEALRKEQAGRLENLQKEGAAHRSLDTQDNARYFFQ